MDTIDYKSVFENLPGCHIVIAANSPNFTIEAVSDSYSEATFTLKDKIIGQDFFSVFCDNPDEHKATGMKNLYDSFHQVMHKFKIHKMEVQKYDVRYYEQEMFVEKYWDPINKPLLDKRNKLHIIHTVTDITVAMKVRQATLRMAERADGKRLHPNLLKGLPGVILFQGPNLHVRFINDVMTMLLGRPREVIIGRPVLSLFGRFLHHENVLDALVKAYTAKEPTFLRDAALWSYRWELERSLNKDAIGNPYFSDRTVKHTLNISFEPVLEKDGSIYGVVAFFSAKE